jgi:hypothetical protein
VPGTLAAGIAYAKCSGYGAAGPDEPEVSQSPNAFVLTIVGVVKGDSAKRHCD